MWQTAITPFVLTLSLVKKYYPKSIGQGYAFSSILPITFSFVYGLLSIFERLLKQPLSLKATFSLQGLSNKALPYI